MPDMRSFRASRRLQAATAAVVVGMGALALAGCGSSSNSSLSGSGSTVATLEAKDTTYAPTAIQLKAGDKVTFVVNNRDQIEHNLTVKDLDVNKDVKGGTTAKATVTVKAGTYEFHCEYHPQQMKGIITVS